jgi:hypothetical protein
MKTTAKQREAARALCEKAMPGPWSIYVDMSFADARRTLLPCLLSDIEELRETLIESTRCLRYATCQVCGDEFGSPDRDCLLADHIESREAVAKADALLEEETDNAK